MHKNLLSSPWIVNDSIRHKLLPSLIGELKHTKELIKQTHILVSIDLTYIMFTFSWQLTRVRESRFNPLWMFEYLPCWPRIVSHCKVTISSKFWLIVIEQKRREFEMLTTQLTRMYMKRTFLCNFWNTNYLCTLNLLLIQMVWTF